MADRLTRLRALLADEEVRSISRRYFVSNGFDGTLTAVGVGILFTFGAYLGALSKQRWYVAGIRMGVAGLVVAAINVVLPG